ncbi:unnamed protein product [Ectocarpus sp. CCAP 1310/34]|nr:unnamed protein product [Ectocarpus sp. CCAP 1310/34]
MIARRLLSSRALQPSCSAAVQLEHGRRGRLGIRRPAPPATTRGFGSTAAKDEPRETMEYDVAMVGAGPAGLAAAIRLKQLSKERGLDLSVCVLEKGEEVGSHILSGNVFEPRGLDELIPDWKEKGAPVASPVTEDSFSLLTETKAFKIPNFLLPPQLSNHGNYVVSLSQLVRWMGQQAEEEGVEVYPGFAAAEVLYNDEGGVVGVATGDVGIAKDGSRKGTFERGIEIRARQTLFAEGARGSCSEEVMSKFDLRQGKDEQTYGLGLKEVWRVPKDKCKPGLVQHTLGWPLQSGPMSKTYGGSFLYHQDPDLILVGLVVGLDYENPHLNPYKEFQRYKHHPRVAAQLEGGECISYGARTLNEGGYHSLPRLTFPGGALLGCAAGFLNAVKIKGAHTAIKSGMLAAEAAFDLLQESKLDPVSESGAVDSSEGALESDFQKRMDESWVMKELKEVRNCHASFAKGMLPGLAYTGLAAHVLKGREPWSFRNGKKDADTTLPADDPRCAPIEYPKPDGVLSFDLLSNLALSGVKHEHDQPAHLRVKAGMEDVASEVSYPKYAGPEQRFCPAAVYEYNVPEGDEGGKPELVINAQNCIHCKCCSIKMPQEYIDWTVPEGGGGPGYTVM